MRIIDLPFVPGFIRRKLSERFALQQIANNFSWLLIDKLLRVVVGLFVYTWTARYLEPELFGLWQYAIAFVAMFLPFSTLGLNNIVVKECVKNPDDQNRLIGTTFWLKLTGGFIGILAALITILFLRSNNSTAQYAVLITSLAYIFQSTDAIDLFFQSKLQSKYTVIAKSTAFLITNGFKIWLILIEAPLLAFVWTAMLEFALAGCFLLIVYRLKYSRLSNWRFSLQTAKRLLKDSWPLILSSVSITIQAQIDQVMLGDMISDKEVAQYAVAMKIMVVITFIPMIIFNSVAPEITKAKQISEDLYYYKLSKIYQLMFFVFLAIGIPIFLFSDFIIHILYGDAYQAAGLLLSLLVIRLFFTNFGVAKTLFITNDNLFKYSLITSVAGSLCNVFFNWLLIPGYASIGAVWATIISFSVTIFVIDIFYYRVRRNLKTMLLAIIDVPQYIKMLKKILSR